MIATDRYDCVWTLEVFFLSSIFWPSGFTYILVDTYYFVVGPVIFLCSAHFLLIKYFYPSEVFSCGFLRQKTLNRMDYTYITTSPTSHGLNITTTHIHYTSHSTLSRHLLVPGHTHSKTNKCLQSLPLRDNTVIHFVFSHNS